MDNKNIDGINNASCGAFWIANTITATFLGQKNCELQKKIAAENQDFQLRIEELKNASQEELEQEKITFRRHLMELIRQFSREERNSSLSKMEQSIQLGAYVQSFPLDLLPATILEEISNNAKSNQLEVILLHTPLLAGAKGQMKSREAYILQQENKLYETLEFNIKERVSSCIGNINFRKDACKKFRTSNADIMNVHYLMGSTPTLIVRPKYQDGKILFTIAMWDEQATRPLIRPLFSISYNPILAQKTEEYQKKVIEKLYFIISIIVGVARDQYAIITWGKAPTLYTMLSDNKDMENFVMKNPTIKNFILQENYSTVVALDETRNPNILRVYERAELKKMQKMLYEQMKYLI